MLILEILQIPARTGGDGVDIVINVCIYIVVTAISYGLLQHCIIGALKEFKKREEEEKALDDE